MPIQKLSPNFEAPVGVEANAYQYNGIERVEDFGLEVSHAQFRTLDAQTGRWWQIDPMAEKFYAWSPYNSNLNNPIRYNDPKGDCPLCPLAPILIPIGIGAGVGALVDISFQVGSNIYEGGLDNAFSDLSKSSTIASATSGALSAFALMNIAALGVTATEGIVMGVVTNTGLGMIESTSKQILSEGTVGGNKVIRDGIISGATGGYGDAASHLFKEFTGESAEKVLPSISINGASEVMENTFQNIGDNMQNSNSSTGNNTKPNVSASPYKNQQRHAPQMLENMPHL